MKIQDYALIEKITVYDFRNTKDLGLAYKVKQLIMAALGEIYYTTPAEYQLGIVLKIANLPGSETVHLKNWVM